MLSLNDTKCPTPAEVPQLREQFDKSRGYVTGETVPQDVVDRHDAPPPAQPFPWPLLILLSMLAGAVAAGWAMTHPGGP